MIVASFRCYLPKTGHDHGITGGEAGGDEEEVGLGGVGDADFEAGDGAVSYCRGGWERLRVGGLAEGGGEEELAGGDAPENVGAELGAAPAEQGQGAGHEGGQGFHGRGAFADLG